MKKLLFATAAGLIMLTACTSEEVIDVSPTQGNVIGFKNVVYKNTRAVTGDLTSTSFDNFLAYGYYTKEGMTTPIQIFNGVSVAKSKNSKGEDEWKYNGVRYWVPNCTYHFYGYSCADIALASGKGTPAMTLTNETSVDGRALSIMGYLCDGTHQHDLVCAESDHILAKDKDNPQVSLGFEHALCKIKAVFTTDFSAGYQVKVSNVKITQFYNRGDYNVGTQVWSNFKIENSPYINMPVDENNNIVTSAPNSAVETAEIFLIPTLYPSTEVVNLHFTIEVSKDGEVVLERSIIGSWAPQWENARIYKYNINITGSSAGIEPIVFAASQQLNGTEWDTSTEVSMVFGVDTPSASNEE